MHLTELLSHKCFVNEIVNKQEKKIQKQRPKPSLLLSKLHLQLSSVYWFLVDLVMRYESRIGYPHLSTIRLPDQADKNHQTWLLQLLLLVKFYRGYVLKFQQFGSCKLAYFGTDNIIVCIANIANSTMNIKSQLSFFLSLCC